jgi:hypothetical protein
VLNVYSTVRKKINVGSNDCRHVLGAWFRPKSKHLFVFTTTATSSLPELEKDRG